MQKASVSFLIFLFPYLLLATCPCSDKITPQQAYENADVVIQGRVESVIPNWVAGGLKISMSIEKSWKRKAEPVFTFNSPEPTLCGFAPHEGERWLVYVNREYKFYSDSCLPNLNLDNEPLLPTFQSSPFSPGMQSSVKRWAWLMGIMVFAGMAFLAFVVFRKKIRN